ncbi:ATP-dependent helicase HrpB [Arcobacter roscoffensis]|uniref:ATP-dependent helicase HrpB n=1 Tax=Arcobacter roscoffensis TaxID=2961520 RepID=A0ABY5E3N9_9BACT|nr:ATP-dependent helicase HrpB [Arcobacter roscoffensis]UTJ05351.1 ATP-dependent helicase HrpB [Arcobacter roscoffensis]
MTNFSINEVIPQIKEVLQNKSNLIIEAPAGAGKSTIVPISLLKESWLEDKIIIVLEPRRVAAIAVASQMARLLGEQVGQTVGYQIKLDSKKSSKTKVLVVTEGILTRMIQSDQALEKCACVIFDEFHERSINTDLGLALCLQAQELLREDLKIVLMSATLQAKELQETLCNFELIKSDGRMFEVKDIYLPLDIKHPSIKDLDKLLESIVLKALKENEGDVLVFLAGFKEINNLKKLLELSLKEDILISPLHSNLSKEEQNIAINKNEKRKVILSTNIAQTSLTIEGVKVVIDSGLEKISRYDFTTGMDHLEYSFICEDSAIQRAGRAGRLSKGLCYKLWHQKRILNPSSTPEILRVDLSSFLLDTSLWGVQDLEELTLLDRPKKEFENSSKELLKSLELLDEKGNITSLGEDVLNLGIHPRLGFMILKANEVGFAKQSCITASLLIENDILKTDSKDFMRRFEAVYEQTNLNNINLNRLNIVKKQADMFFTRLNKIKEIKREKSFDKNLLGVILLFAYPDRLAKKRVSSDNTYALSNKKAAIISDENLQRNEYLVAVNISAKQTNSYINQALAIDFKLLDKYLKNHFTTSIESINKDNFELYEVLKFEQLVISYKKASSISKEEYINAILDFIKTKGVKQTLNFDKKALSLQNRINFYNKAKKQNYKCDLDLMDFSDEYLSSSVEIWLKPFLNNIKKFEDLQKLDIYTILLSNINYEVFQSFDKEVPTHINVPSGSKIKIDYSDSSCAVLAVKIQEVFSLHQTPKVLNNQIPLTIHLLTPAQRPIQITQDLRSFWDNSYEEVRKELRGKYKKHYWPENPYDAVPTNRVKKNM